MAEEKNSTNQLQRKQRSHWSPQNRATKIFFWALRRGNVIMMHHLVGWCHHISMGGTHTTLSHSNRFNIEGFLNDDASSSHLSLWWSWQSGAKGNHIELLKDTRILSDIYYCTRFELHTLYLLRIISAYSLLLGSMYFKVFQIVRRARYFWDRIVRDSPYYAGVGRWWVFFGTISCSWGQNLLASSRCKILKKKPNFFSGKKIKFFVAVIFRCVIGRKTLCDRRFESHVYLCLILTG